MQPETDVSGAVFNPQTRWARLAGFEFPPALAAATLVALSGSSQTALIYSQPLINDAPAFPSNDGGPGAGQIVADRFTLTADSIVDALT